MTERRALNRAFTKEEVEARKPPRQKFDIDDYKPSGNLYKGVKTKDGRRLDYVEPSDAAAPTETWRMYPYKGDQEVDVPVVMTRAFTLFGRVAANVDVVLRHRSVEPQHAVVQFRTFGERVLPYVIDLGSKEGTWLNKQRVAPKTYVELRHGDVVWFGRSSTDYLVLNEKQLKKAKKLLQ